MINECVIALAVGIVIAASGLRVAFVIPFIERAVRVNLPTASLGSRELAMPEQLSLWRQGGQGVELPSFLWHKRSMNRAKLIAFLLVLGILIPMPGYATPPARNYVASKERQQQILNGYPKLTTGMSFEDVKSILGEPDGIVPSLDTKGKNYQYILEVTGNPQTGYYENLINVKVDEQNKVTEVRHIRSGGRTDRDHR